MSALRLLLIRVLAVSAAPKAAPFAFSRAPTAASPTRDGQFEPIFIVSTFNATPLVTWVGMTGSSLDVSAFDAAVTTASALLAHDTDVADVVPGAGLRGFDGSSVIRATISWGAASAAFLVLASALANAVAVKAASRMIARISTLFNTRIALSFAILAYAIPSAKAQGYVYAVRTLAGSVVGSSDGVGTNALFSRPTSATMGPSGYVHVIDSANHKIRLISPDGTVTTLAGGGSDGYTAGSNNGVGTNALFQEPYGITLAPTGDAYVTDTTNAKVLAITPGGVVTTLAGGGSDGVTSGSANGVGTNALFNGPRGIAVHASGTVYFADSYNHEVRSITPLGVVSTLSGGGADGITAGSTNGVGSNALFNQPRSVAVNSAGVVFVADTYNGLIRSITPLGVTTTLAGNGPLFAWTNNGIGSNAFLAYPNSVAVDMSGSVLFTETPATVRKVTPSGIVTTVVGGALSGTPGGRFNDGIGTNVGFSFGNDGGGISFGVKSDIYIADVENARIRVLYNMTCPAGHFCATQTDMTICPTGSYCPSGSVSPIACPANSATVYTGASVLSACYTSSLVAVSSGAATSTTLYNTTCESTGTCAFYYVVTTVAGGGATGNEVGNLDGVGTNALFNGPESVAVNGTGHVFIVDNNKLRSITPSGVVQTLAGGGAGGSSTGSTNGIGTNALFIYLSAVTLDALGNVYIGGDYKVRMVTTPALVVTTLAGGGAGGSSTGSTNGVGTNALFNGISGLAVNSSGYIIVADSSNHKIRIITMAGIVTTLAGGGVGGTSSGKSDGVGTNALFNYPSGLAIHTNGNILVSDTNNLLVRRITPSGTVSTYASLISNLGLGGSPPIWGISLDNSGNVYVAARSSYKICLITPNGSFSSIAGSLLGPLVDSVNSDGIGSAAGFYYPNSVATFADSLVYVADTWNYKIRLITKTTCPAGYFCSTPTDFALCPTGFYCPYGSKSPIACPPSSPSMFSGAASVSSCGHSFSLSPAAAAIAVSPVSPLVDTSCAATNTCTAVVAQRSTRLSSTGAWTNDVGAAQWTLPFREFVVSSSGVFIFPESSGGVRIRKMFTNGTLLTVAGGGISGSTTGVIDGVGTNALFSTVISITLDSDESIFLVDRNNNKVRVVSPTGMVTTVAGGGATGTMSGATNGIGTNALFNFPSSIALFGGTLYVVDLGNYKIRAISSSATVTTLAGGGLSGTQSGSADGVGTNAGFTSFYGFTLDTAGNLYVLDNCRLRRITGGVVSIFAGGSCPTTFLSTNGGRISAGYGTNAALGSSPGTLFFSNGNIFIVIYSMGLASVSLAGKVTLFAGTDVTNYQIAGPDASNGVGTNLLFNQITAGCGGGAISTSTEPLAGTGTGTLYVNDGSLVRIPFSLCPVGYFCASPSDSILCPTGSYCPAGSLEPTPCPAGTTTAFAGGSSVSACSGLAVTSSAPGSSCASNSTCSSLSCRGGFCCSNSSALLGCSSCSPTTGACLTVSSGDSCASPYDCSTGACLGGCCCNSVAAQTSGCTACRCASAASTGAVAGACTTPGVVGATSATLSNATCEASGSCAFYYMATTFAGGGATGNEFGYSDGVGTNALFNGPQGVAVNTTGYIFVADSGNHKIRSISPTGIVATFAGGGAGGTTSGSTNGVGTNALFNSPSYISADNSGNLYVVDSPNVKVRVIAAPLGTVATFAGGGVGGAASGSVNGIGTNALFSWLYGVATDSVGNVYTADQYKIRLISPSGVVSTLAGGAQGNSDGVGTNALFQNPSGIAVTAAATVYVVDSFTAVRMISPSGMTTTIGKNDFYNPRGVAVDTLGNILVADLDASLVRCIPPGGAVTTVVGKGVQVLIQNNNNDGIGTAAGIGAPFSLAVFKHTHIYVTDSTGSKIRLITKTTCPAGYFCSTPTDFALCPTGFYCPYGSKSPIACPPSSPSLFAGAASSSACGLSTSVTLVSGTASLSSTGALAGSTCSSNSTCTSLACRGGFCCSNSSALLGCSTCSSQTGACVTANPGDVCSSPFDCASSVCLGGCCCTNAAAQTVGCSSCRCLAASDSAPVTAGSCSASYSSISLAAPSNVTLSCNSSVSVNSSVSLSRVISFPATANVSGTAPLVFLPASSPLNTYGVDIIVASASACAAYSSALGSAKCTASMYALPDGTYYFLGLASDLGMTAAPSCAA